MTKPRASLDRAATFLWSNARTLERALFARRYRGGPGAAVVAALRAFRNDDGGFGHALEPDVRAPESMALHCELALRALRDAGVRDRELAGGVAAFAAGVAEADGRVPMLGPTALDYPHARHWEYGIFAGDSPNPTAALAGLLHQQGVAHPWLDRATAWCWERLERPIESAHELLAALVFTEHAPERARAEGLAAELGARAAAAGVFVDDAYACEREYGLTPLHLFPGPDVPGRAALEGPVFERHLDALAGRQQDDGGWPLNFEPPSPAAALEWRGRWTLDALDTLRAWGRLQALPGPLARDGAGP